MTVAELKEELGCYEDDDEVIFEIDDEFEPEEVTENKYGWRTVRLRSRLKPSFFGSLHGSMRIELEVEKE